jgi:hypothetical protein
VEVSDDLDDLDYSEEDEELMEIAVTSLVKSIAAKNSS